MFYGLDCLEIAMKKRVILNPVHSGRFDSGVLADRDVADLAIVVAGPPESNGASGEPSPAPKR